MRRLLVLALGCALPMGLVIGCGASDDAEMSASGADRGAYNDAGASGTGPTGGEGGEGGLYCNTTADCPTGYSCFRGQCLYQGGGVGGAGGDDGLPPEEESEALTFTPPAAGAEHVWVASPTTDQVIKINAETLAVTPIEVGDDPTIVHTVPGEDVAVVLNRGSDEVTLIWPDTLAFFDLPHHFNALTMDPCGRYAFVWFDMNDARPGEDTSAVQDMVVIDIEGGTLHRVSVGFRPRRVAFTACGGRALVVTEDGLSLIDPDGLPERSIARQVPLAPDVFHTADREVKTTPDGRYAISRGPGEAGVTIVDIEVGEPHFVNLDALPSDLDLLPDGRTALVMLRSANALAFVPLDDADPEAIERVEFPGHILGSAAVGAGPVAVLYTTLADEDRPHPMAMLDLETGDMVYQPSRKQIAGVILDPTGETAFVLHVPSASVDPDPIAASEAYSLMDLTTGFTKLQTTRARARGLLYATDRAEAYALLGSPSQPTNEVHRIDLAGFEVQTYPLGSTPEAVGLLSDVNQAFVTQTHPTGRISFLNLADDTANLRTVSGYTLNGRIQ